MPVQCHHPISFHDAGLFVRQTVQFVDKTDALPVGDCAGETCGQVSAGCLLYEYYLAKTHAEQRSLEVMHLPLLSSFSTRGCTLQRSGCLDLT